MSDTETAASYLVLQIDRSVEVRDLGVDRLANELTLTGVHERSHLYSTAKLASTDHVTHPSFKS